MSDPTDAHVDLAVRAFLINMLRESVKRSPDAETHSVPSWDQLSVTDKGVLRRSMKVALVGVARKQAQEAKYTRVQPE
jgi:hypothetical protein